MAKSNKPFSNSIVALRTEKLINEKKTDIQRWKNQTSLASEWDQRAAHVAKHIADGSKVLDIGCGAMSLEKHLGPQCCYQPADVVERRPGCLVIDLNLGEFPSLRVDVITFLGVMEYLFSPSDVLKKARAHADKLVFSYCIPTKEATAYRRGLGWVNEYSESEILGFLKEAGWVLDFSELNKTGPNSNQMLFMCSGV